ncbi:MAG: hypothetical protein QM802_09690 [Agriterribacter sp.]
MRKRPVILITIIVGIFLLSLLLIYLRNRFDGFGFVIRYDILAIVVLALLFITSSFIAGFFSWLFFQKKQPYKLFHFIIFNLLSLIVLLVWNTNEIYKIWHYDKYQANIDYNESLTKHNGNFIDTCMIMVQNDIKKQGVQPNDYRILVYSYDQALATNPRDTTNKYYSFDVTYSRKIDGKNTVRLASYFVNFHQVFKRVYDVDSKDKKAKEQIEALKQDFMAIKKALEKFPDSTDDYFDKLKKHLKTLD